jgi:hypothetical protein
MADNTRILIRPAYSLGPCEYQVNDESAINRAVLAALRESPIEEVTIQRQPHGQSWRDSGDFEQGRQSILARVRALPSPCVRFTNKLPDDNGEQVLYRCSWCGVVAGSLRFQHANGCLWAEAQGEER